MPRLILPSMQVNMRAGHLPEPEDERHALPQAAAQPAVRSADGNRTPPCTAMAGGLLIGSAAGLLLLLLRAHRRASAEWPPRATRIADGGPPWLQAVGFVLGLPLGALIVPWPLAHLQSRSPRRCPCSSPAGCSSASAPASATAAPAATACAGLRGSRRARSPRPRPSWRAGIATVFIARHLVGG